MPDTMTTLTFTDFNQLTLESKPIPALTNPDDVLVRVRAAGVCGSDLHGYTGQSGRRTPPLVMGHEAAGEVAAVGAAVTGWKVGDRAAIQPLVVCNQCAMCRSGNQNLCENRELIGMQRPGAYAEYLITPQQNLHAIPDSLSDEAAALAEPLAVTLHAVSLARIQPYDTALIVGAGPIGLLTLVLLRNTPLRTLMVSDLDDARLAVARQLGADVTLNAARDDVAAAVKDATDGQGVDLSFEAVGVDATVAQSLDAVRNHGQVIWIGNNKRMIHIDMQAVVTRELNVRGTYGMSPADFSRAVQMLADGIIPTDTLINRRAKLAESVTLFDELLNTPDIIKCIITP